jgi:hypothetical protein
VIAVSSTSKTAGRWAAGRRPASLKRCPNFWTQFHTATSDRSTPSKNARDLPETHPEIVQQDRQFDDLTIRAFALEKLNLVHQFSNFGKVHFNQFH